MCKPAARLGLKGKGFSQRRDWFGGETPDVAAPGVSILAAYPPMGTKHGSGYAFLSGTSMACPHATRMVALIKSAHPDWSPAAIRSALVTTVSQKGTDGMDITEMGPTLRKADPFDIGGGHVNPNRAINLGLIYNISKQDYIQFIGINSELLVVALVQVNGDQDMFVVSVLLQKKIYRSDLQLEMALQQQQFEQQPQRNVEQPTVSRNSDKSSSLSPKQEAKSSKDKCIVM